jgi:hypothetical protein
MKIGPVKAELLNTDRWTDGRTDWTKLPVATALKMTVAMIDK